VLKKPIKSWSGSGARWATEQLYWSRAYNQTNVQTMENCTETCQQQLGVCSSTPHHSQRMYPCHVLWLHILFGCHRTPKISDPDYVRHCLSAITLVLLVRTAYDSLWLLCYALCFSITESWECQWYLSQLDFTWLVTTHFHHGPTRNSEAPVLTLIPTNTSIETLTMGQAVK
jgi:hypothetical protein